MLSPIKFLLIYNNFSLFSEIDNRISLQRSCLHQNIQSSTIMNWRSKRKCSKNISNSKLNNSEQCSTVSSKTKSTNQRQAVNSVTNNLQENSEENHASSHSNVSQSSPYLFHFLVLVLLTFAQFAGKE